MSTAPDSFEQLLEQCAEEPIHIPGNIQPYGCLIAVRASDREIVYASENTDQYLDRSATDLLGRPARELFGDELSEDLLANATETPARRYIQDFPGLTDAVHCTTHTSGAHLVCEFEPAEEVDAALMSAFYEIQEDLLDQPTVKGILQSGVAAVADLTGFEHVMIYRFHPNWDGEVVAERVSDRRPSYQGHRFPASDIPKQARELYRENTFRIIPDAQYQPVSILALEDRRQQYLNRYQGVLQLPHRFLGKEKSLPTHLVSKADELMELVEAEGLVVRMFGETRTAGQVPPEPRLNDLLEWLGTKDIDNVWHTDSLARTYGDGEEIVDTASGVLAIELPKNGTRLIWLRPEVIQTIEWGGNPHKPVTRNTDDGDLSPRNSFETWKEQVEHSSEAWRSEQVAAARVLRQYLLEAVMAEASRRRSEQLDVIHQILRHDIQNKAGVIAAYADMLSDIEEPRMQRYAHRISRASQDTIALTKSAWALARVIRSGGEVERSAVAINPLVNRIVESMEATHGDAVITMDSSQTSGADLNVLAGPLLDSVIRNLISNAIKHNDKDWKKVHVEVEELPSTVEIHVADNGPGIPEPRREAIFAEGETRLDESSMGIGLYLVRLITGRYDGEVWVEDNEPEGSIFTVQLVKVGEDEG